MTLIPGPQLARIEHKLDQLLVALDHWGKKIMATQQELTVQLTAINAQLVKIGTETTSLLTAIDELKAVIANAPVTPELQAAVDKVAQQAGVIDALVPDLPTP